MSKLVTVVPILRNQHTHSVVGVRPQKALNAQLAPYGGQPLVEMDQTNACHRPFERPELTRHKRWSSLSCGHMIEHLPKAAGRVDGHR
jgi:hypothetical protein